MLSASSPRIFKSRFLSKSEAFIQVIPKESYTTLAQFSRCPFWYNLAVALVRKSKIDWCLVCLHAHHALEMALVSICCKVQSPLCVFAFYLFLLLRFTYFFFAVVLRKNVSKVFKEIKIKNK